MLIRHSTGSQLPKPEVVVPAQPPGKALSARTLRRIEQIRKQLDQLREELRRLQEEPEGITE
jgi:hypothetical protein